MFLGNFLPQKLSKNTAMLHSIYPPTCLDLSTAYIRQTSKTSTQYISTKRREKHRILYSPTGHVFSPCPPTLTEILIPPTCLKIMPKRQDLSESDEELRAARQYHTARPQMLADLRVHHIEKLDLLLQELDNLEFVIEQYAILLRLSQPSNPVLIKNAMPTNY